MYGRDEHVLAHHRDVMRRVPGARPPHEAPGETIEA